MTELNPHGINVTGQPFWNGVHKGWWTKPDIGQLVDAYEQAYADHKSGRVNRTALRDFAMQYDHKKVAELYAKPAIDELLERMKNRG
jgi:hypothetical protein